MIEIKNLDVKIGNAHILQGVNVKFEKGKVHGIIGLNGSGKTTLFKVLYRHIQKFSGHILYDCENLRRSDIAFLPTDNFFYYNLTGREYLNIFPSAFSMDVLNDVELFFGLPLDKLIHNYSSGMKKKLALLGVLRLNRSIYLFDEPFNGLDIESAYLLKKIIKALKTKNRTIILSSHILETLIGLCDSYFILESGKVEEIQNTEDLQLISARLDEKYDTFINRFVSEG
jgi:ABC-2 type transport system ATP-binding protein